MTLTSDNTLRLFNLDLEQEKAEETIRLSEGTYFFSRQITMFNFRIKPFNDFFFKAQSHRPYLVDQP